MLKSTNSFPMEMQGSDAERAVFRDDYLRPVDNGARAFALAVEIPPPSFAGESSEEHESERERLLRVWRLHPEAEVDLCCEEEQGGAQDGRGLVRLTEKNGAEVDEFRFSSGEEADEAVDFALRAMNPSA